MGLNPEMHYVPLAEIANKLGFVPETLSKWIERFNQKYPNDYILRWGRSYDVFSLSRALAISNGLIEPSSEQKLVLIFTPDGQSEESKAWWKKMEEAGLQEIPEDDPNFYPPGHPSRAI